jgi:hypothetical protein
MKREPPDPAFVRNSNGRGDRVNRLLSIALLSAGLHLPAQAHHSHAMFDHSRTITVTGEITNFSFRNPHVYLWLDVQDEDGEVKNWAIEMSTINNMVGRGINASTFKVGDMATVTVNPLRDGRAGGNYTSITAADGVTYE